MPKYTLVQNYLAASAANESIESDTLRELADSRCEPDTKEADDLNKIMSKLLVTKLKTNQLTTAENFVLALFFHHGDAVAQSNGWAIYFYQASEKNQLASAAKEKLLSEKTPLTANSMALFTLTSELTPDSHLGTVAWRKLKDQLSCALFSNDLRMVCMLMLETTHPPASYELFLIAAGFLAENYHRDENSITHAFKNVIPHITNFLYHPGLLFSKFAIQKYNFLQTLIVTSPKSYKCEEFEKLRLALDFVLAYSNANCGVPTKAFIHQKAWELESHLFTKWHPELTDKPIELFYSNFSAIILDSKTLELGIRHNRLAALTQAYKEVPIIADPLKKRLLLLLKFAMHINCRSDSRRKIHAEMIKHSTHENRQSLFHKPNIEILALAKFCLALSLRFDGISKYSPRYFIIIIDELVKANFKLDQENEILKEIIDPLNLEKALSVLENKRKEMKVEQKAAALDKNFPLQEKEESDEVEKRQAAVSSMHAAFR